MIDPIDGWTNVLYFPRVVKDWEFEMIRRVGLSDEPCEQTHERVGGICRFPIVKDEA